MCAKGVTTVIAVGENRVKPRRRKPVTIRTLATIGTDPRSALATLAGPRHWVVA